MKTSSSTFEASKYRDYDWSLAENVLGPHKPYEGIVSQLLSGIGGRDECEALRSGTCSQSPTLADAGWGYPACCATASSEVLAPKGGNPDLLMSGIADETLDTVSSQWNRRCEDMLSIEYLEDNKLNTFVHSIFFTFAAYAPGKTETCPSGCPSPYKPFCKQGRCVTPSCADAAPYCHRPDTLDGVLARMFCPVTCGCNLARSPLHFSRTDSGCAKACQAKRSAKVAKLPCTDVGLGSPNFTAFVDNFINDRKDILQAQGLISILTKVRAKGCRALNQTNVRELTRQGRMNAPKGLARGVTYLCFGDPANAIGQQDGLAVFCPVACACSRVPGSSSAQQAEQCPASCWLSKVCDPNANDPPQSCPDGSHCPANGVCPIQPTSPPT